MTQLQQRGHAPRVNSGNWELVREKATEKLCARWANKLSRAGVEDKVQEAIICTEERMKEGETINSPLAHVIKSAHYALCNEYRDQHYEERTDFDGVEETIVSIERSVEQQVEDSDTVDAILDCAQHLPDRQKEAFLLYYVEELSHREIQDKMNIGLGSVRKYLDRAANRVRSLMIEKGY